MIYISHRGFINGKDTKLENNPDQINYLLEQNINVEIDVRFYKNKFYLGHDEPSYEIDKKFLNNSKLWCHAKNYETLNVLTKIDCHYFWHQEDDYTLTSKGVLWVYPGKKLTKNSICVLPELSDYKIFDCLGICSDFIKRYKND